MSHVFENTYYIICVFLCFLFWSDLVFLYVLFSLSFVLRYLSILLGSPSASPFPWISSPKSGQNSMWGKTGHFWLCAKMLGAGVETVPGSHMMWNDGYTVGTISRTFCFVIHWRFASKCVEFVQWNRFWCLCRLLEDVDHELRRDTQQSLQVEL